MTIDASLEKHEIEQQGQGIVFDVWVGKSMTLGLVEYGEDLVWRVRG